MIITLNLYIVVLKTTRYISNTNQTGVSNITDTNDTLITNIKLAKQTINVLEMLRIHNPVMTSQQHLQALNSLFILQKNNK